MSACTGVDSIFLGPQVCTGVKMKFLFVLLVLAIIASVEAGGYKRRPQPRRMFKGYGKRGGGSWGGNWYGGMGNMGYGGWGYGGGMGAMGYGGLGYGGGLGGYYGGYATSYPSMSYGGYASSYPSMSYGGYASSYPSMSYGGYYSGYPSYSGGYYSSGYPAYSGGYYSGGYPMYSGSYYTGASYPAYATSGLSTGGVVSTGAAVPAASNVAALGGTSLASAIGSIGSFGTGSNTGYYPLGAATYAG
ncbi:keratin-associated protein 6-2-like [Saccostrea echinata]|uniref:keratin-associated protein 6-2-like n=1 Tax=Saccostrea echinata TaxID=191078 RepID=UPI002A81A398|nr:keratin-associated protein 6-2-like [Saccostrea echinata]